MAKRLFLERRTYRQNRLQDAARLLPVLGLILLFGPIFIRDDAASGAASGLTDAPTLAAGLVYYFAVWLGLIVLTAGVSRAMMGGSSGPGTGGVAAGGVAAGGAGGSVPGSEPGPVSGTEAARGGHAERSHRGGRGVS